MSRPNRATPAIGVPQPLIDGPDKVSGRARYAADFSAPGALVGRVKKSPVAHARIIKVDVSRALAMPGVKAALSGAEIENSYGVLPIAMNEYAIAKDRVRYRGEPIAAVAAVDVETAERALREISFEYEELPAYFDSESARAEDAVLLHDDKPGNIERHAEFELGDTEAGFRAADLVLERSFNNAEVCQVQSEPHAAYAEYDGEREQYRYTVM